MRRPAPKPCGKTPAMRTAPSEQYALNTNSTGGANAAFGFHALHNNSTGNYNSAFGESALYYATASENTALGRYALNQTTTGDGNTAAGLLAGSTNVNGTYNTFVGWKADADSSHQGLTYATALGAGAVVTQDYSIALGAPNGVTGAVSVGIGTSAPTAKLEVVGGNVKVTGGMLFADNVGIGTTTPGYQLHVVGTARVTDTLYVKCAVVNGTPTGSCSSDARFKRDVQPFGSVLDRVALLQPVHYYWRAEEFPDRHFEDVRATGLIAQDVEKLFPEMVGTDDKGFKQLNYGEVPYLTLAAVKELKAKSDRLEAENAAMKAANATLAARLGSPRAVAEADCGSTRGDGEEVTDRRRPAHARPRRASAGRPTFSRSRTAARRCAGRSVLRRSPATRRAVRRGRSARGSPACGRP